MDEPAPPGDRDPNWSRRAFLKGTAAGAAAAAVIGAAGDQLAEAAQQRGARVLGPGRVPIQLHVNGATKTVRVEPRTTLAAALREQLGLTGTKVGCDRGACSACTVHLDGAAALSCMTLAIDVGERKITTIEGLASGDRLHPVQAAFVEHDATQCGYCTPGMVMSCAALVARDPKPSLPVIRQAVSGNLCRCGTYPKVFTAVLTATGQKPTGWTLDTMSAGDGAAPPAGHAWVGLSGEKVTAQPRDTGPGPAAWPTNTGLAVVGKPTPRLDGRAKVTGTARYTADVYLPGMLYARRVVSPHAHARVTRIDTSKAERLAGVRAVHVVTIQEGATLLEPSKEAKGKYPRIRYVGQCVAGVAATNPSIAEQAAQLIEVTYEVLPAVVDTDHAMKPDAPVVYPGRVDMGGSAGGGGAAAGLPQRGNIRGPNEQVWGDVEAGMRSAALTVRAQYRTQVQTHSPMEPHGIVAHWQGTGANSQLTVYASTQGTNTVRDELSTVFKLPKAKVRVITEFMGGGFGAKFGAGHFGVMATELSRKARAPVRLVLDREEQHVAVGNRPSSIQDLAIGAARDGKLVAVDLTSHGTAGIGAGAGVGWAAARLYPTPNLRSQQFDVFTHAGAGAAFRAPGMPQAMFALEQSIDELAERIGIDPLALRDRLDVDDPAAASTDPRTPPPGAPDAPKPESPFIPAMDRTARRRERAIGAQKIGWGRRGPPGRTSGPLKYGIGMAQSQWGRFITLDSNCEVRVARDGSVALRSSVGDLGTGTRTAIAMVLAEDLGLRAEDITVEIGDTRWPAGPSSGGSRTLISISPAVREAAHGVRAKVLAAAARRLKARPEELVIGRGNVAVAANPSRSVTWKQACAALDTEEVIAQGKRTDDWNGKPRGGLGGVQFAEVSVDIETGEVRVLKVVAVHDCGRPINPLAVQSQINGGILQGISWALYEERALDPKTGRMLNPNVDQYKILGSRETPFIDVVLLEQYIGKSNTDVAGIGEPANVATAAAVANAIYNAIGVRIRELPITPARVLAALRGAPPAVAGRGAP